MYSGREIWKGRGRYLFVLCFFLTMNANSIYASCVNAAQTRNLEKKLENSLVEQLKGYFKSVLEKPTLSEKSWTCRTGACIPSSRQLYNYLQMYYRGPFQFQRVYYSNFEKGHFTVHAYLLALNSGVAVIVDPTWKQFVNNKEKYEDLADLFVGTQEDLISILSRAQTDIDVPWFNEVNFDVRRLVERTWPIANPGRGSYEINVLAMPRN